MAELHRFPLFMDVEMGGFSERMIFEIFYDLAPATAENFRGLCEGDSGISSRTKYFLCYYGCFFHQFREGSSCVMGGAISYDTEEYVENLYGRHFPIESNHMKHDKEGLLSMSRRDQKAGSSKFLITLKADQSLDSSHVIFGRLVGGLITLRNIGEVCFRSPIKIVRCGVQYDGSVPRGVTLRIGEDDAKWIKWFEEGKMKKRVEDWGDWPSITGAGKDCYPIVLPDGTREYINA